MGGIQGRPYTKWYRVWERVTIADFYAELFIIPVILVVILINTWGASANKSRAKQWMSSHLPALDGEYAQVCFKRRASSVDDVQEKSKTAMKASDVPDELLRQKGKNEYFTYATGRQNVAHLDVKLTLYKRFNPFIWFAETAASFFFDSIATPVERVEATAYVFDGKEKALTPNGASSGKDSTFDGFVFAVVHKDKMKQLRDDRYDISLTSTRDHQKLPEWATVMSESAEITEAMLTSELVKAIEDCGEDLEALIISDQPIEAPKKYKTLPSHCDNTKTDKSQTQRHRPPQARIPLHAPQPQPLIHRPLQHLPSPPRYPRQHRPLPARSHAQSARDPRRGDPTAEEDRRR